MTRLINFDYDCTTLKSDLFMSKSEVRLKLFFIKICLAVNFPNKNILCIC